MSGGGGWLDSDDVAPVLVSLQTMEDRLRDAATKAELMGYTQADVEALSAGAAELAAVRARVEEQRPGA